MDAAISDWTRRLGEDLRGWQGPLAALPALVTYFLATLGLQLTGAPSGEWAGETTSAGGSVVMVTVFTLSHGFGPAALLGFAWKTRMMAGPMGWIFLGLSYGIPALVLASWTGWLSVLGAASHLGLAPRGTRLWTAIEYGSSSFCLMIFLIYFPNGLFPLGLLALGFQLVMLLVMHLTVRHLWVGERAGVELG